MKPSSFRGRHTPDSGSRLLPADGRSAARRAAFRRPVGAALFVAAFLLAAAAAVFAAGEAPFNAAEETVTRGGQRPILPFLQEKGFDSPEDAVKALVSAAQTGDTNTLHAIFGPIGRELVSPDVVQASAEREIFLRRLKARTDLVKQSDTKAELEIGADGWPFPMPLVKEGNLWFFDTAAGAEEILNRRIGRNEIGAIQVCHAYVQAQREYAARDYNGDGVVEYARLLRSNSGARDGLYWPAQEGGELSPLGPLIAQAHFEGYHGSAGTKALADDQSAPYHGYYFKILTRQGRNAAGGKYNYIINGHMVAGFALLAWPAEWGNSGVMTFMVNQSGKIYEKSLGPKTSVLAPRISSFDPDASWSPTKEE